MQKWTLKKQGLPCFFDPSERGPPWNGSQRALGKWEPVPILNRGLLFGDCVVVWDCVKLFSFGNGILNYEKT